MTSLTSSLYLAMAGLQNAQAHVSTTSSNISNADKVGYTRKTYEASYTTTNAATFPAGGAITSFFNKAMFDKVVGYTTTNSYMQKIAEFLDSYNSRVLGVSSGDLPSLYSNFEKAITNLAAAPEDQSRQTSMLQAAQALSESLNASSRAIQNLRKQADHEIAGAVNDFNALLHSLDDLNEKIITYQASKQDTAYLIDERNNVLEKMASYMNISYFTADNGTVKVYTSAGQPLLDSTVHELSFTESVTVDAQASYPTSLNGIILNNADISGSFRGGIFDALLTLRDTTFVNEQEKLDNVAQGLIDTVNRVYSQATAYPPPASMQGQVQGLTGASPINGTGTVRVAITDNNGVVQGFQDINLATVTDVNDLLTQLNSIPGMNATLDANGALVMQTTAPNGIAMNQMDSDINGESFASFFGVNSLFQGDSASNIRVGRDLLSASQPFASAVLSDSPTLAVGTSAISVGDASIVQALSDALSTPQNFSPAGNMPAKTISFSEYLASVVAHSASIVSNALSTAEQSQLTYTTAKEAFVNAVGVNVDEENATLLLYQNAYEANARMMSVIQELFKTLLEAVS